MRQTTYRVIPPDARRAQAAVLARPFDAAELLRVVGGARGVGSRGPLMISLS